MMISMRLVTAVVCGSAIAVPMHAHAYRMVQNTSVGRSSFGAAVPCNAASGFAHWNASSIAWRLNTSGQGSKPGVLSSLQSAMAAWTAVSPASYAPVYAGTTTNGFVTDGVNTVLWANGNGCTGGCLAITALVLGPGQVITEADVSFNNAPTWNTNGSDYDVQAIAAHELGHTLGVHHTDITRRKNRPTMYASYFGTDGRSLESDDRDALNCAYTRYLPGGAPGGALAAVDAERGTAPGLTARPRPGGAILRYALASPQRIRLEVFDVAGRSLATLVNDVRGAGEHEVAWDGTTTFGRARSGVYFARISSLGGPRATTTVLLME